jgi:hypothetical protein
MKRDAEKEKANHSLQTENLKKDKEDLLDKLAVSFNTLKELKIEFERLQDKHRVHEHEKSEMRKEIRTRDEKVLLNIFWMIF